MCSPVVVELLAAAVLAPIQEFPLAVAAFPYGDRFLTQQ
jgi:hypothetical protein